MALKKGPVFSKGRDHSEVYWGKRQSMLKIVWELSIRTFCSVEVWRGLRSGVDPEEAGKIWETFEEKLSKFDVEVKESDEISLKRGEGEEAICWGGWESSEVCLDLKYGSEEPKTCCCSFSAVSFKEEGLGGGLRGCPLVELTFDVTSFLTDLILLIFGCVNQ